MNQEQQQDRVDLLIVGAGIIGLSHAFHARRRGLKVVVVDRDHRAVGASVRNFGHCCITAQSGELLELAQTGRSFWLEASAQAGFFSSTAGALAVARSELEFEILQELSANRPFGQVQLLDRAEVAARLSGYASPDIIGGALLRDDLRVDPREAVGKLANWLADQGVSFHWGTSFFSAEDGIVHTSRGSFEATQVLVCVGHDLDLLYPETAETSQISRCGLQMARVAAPEGLALDSAVLSGTSMLRYPAFSETSAAAGLRQEIAEHDAEALAIDANIMFTQRPDGTMIVGDSHRLAETMDPFLTESVSTALLHRVAGLLGVPQLDVLERWQGIYASSPLRPYLISAVSPGVTAVSVTSGVGMTISFGLAQRVLAQLDFH
ncbi:TIGR03364 family FAD-dependent oxidoreductase [Psychromicrobium sp. YIM B11713]|uniref:TIGR03364 family FAD-dependent oxidoreductase n=1 Tax=Psychromicrobium sp. YIM B11713 TaxID=3145233 RepID=UPI00374E8C63